MRWVVFLGFLVLGGVDSPGDDRAPATGGIGERETSPPVLAFISDTQHPFVWESLIFRTRHNIASTAALFTAIRSSHPTEVFILGDVVSLGFSSSAWEDIDTLVYALRQDSIHVHGILGNHDVMLSDALGEENFQKRFPDHNRSGYVVTVDSMAVVLLNSNLSAPGDSESTRQQDWYRRTLERFQLDPSVRAIVVCCHHSPYTNSRVVRPSAEVRRLFVPLFLSTPKCRLFLSGHAHTFEHFRIGGKDFLVIGGGGGAQHPLYEGEDQRWKDLSPSQKPPFHFVDLRRCETRIVITANRLESASKTMSSFYVVNVPLE